MKQPVDYYPASQFSNITTNVERWEVRSGRVVVKHTDGSRFRSECTPAELAADTSLLRCPCPEAPSRDCRVHGDGN